MRMDANDVFICKHINRHVHTPIITIRLIRKSAVLIDSRTQSILRLCPATRESNEDSGGSARCLLWAVAMQMLPGGSRLCPCVCVCLSVYVCVGVFAGQMWWPAAHITQALATPQTADPDRCSARGEEHARIHRPIHKCTHRHAHVYKYTPRFMYSVHKMCPHRPTGAGERGKLDFLGCIVLGQLHTLLLVQGFISMLLFCHINHLDRI